MFKLVKWAFHLGQQTERQRIEGILNDRRKYYRRHDPIASKLFGGRAQKDPSPEQREIELQVEMRVDDIISAIIKLQPADGKYFSLLYPEEREL